PDRTAVVAAPLDREQKAAVLRIEPRESVADRLDDRSPDNVELFEGGLSGLQKRGAGRARERGERLRGETREAHDDRGGDQAGGRGEIVVRLPTAGGLHTRR